MSFAIKKQTVFIFLCGLFMLSGCVANKTATTSTFNSGTLSKPIDKVLVIAVASHRDQSIRYEDLMVNELTKANINAISAHRKLPSDVTKIDREIALKLVSEHGVNGVMVTQLVNAELNRNKKQKRTELVVDKPSVDSFLDIFAYEIKEVEAMTDNEISTTIIITTDVYSPIKQAKVASVETEVKGVQDGYSKMMSSAHSIVGKLQQKGVLAKK